MYIFVDQGQRYFKDGFEWEVLSIKRNLVKSTCIGHDINDLEELKEFNRQVVTGEIYAAFADSNNIDVFNEGDCHGS